MIIMLAFLGLCTLSFLIGFVATGIHAVISGKKSAKIPSAFAMGEHDPCGAAIFCDSEHKKDETK